MSGLYESVVFNGFGEPAVKSYKINVHKKNENMNFQNLLECRFDSPTRFEMNSSGEEKSIGASNCKSFDSSFHYTAFAAVTVMLLFIQNE